MTSIPQKTCSRCKLAKPLEEFGKNRARYDGLQNNCKACSREIDKARNATPERQANLKLSPDERIAQRNQRNQEWTQEVERRRAALSKVCSCCSQEKPVTEFQKNQHEVDGFQRWCNACRHEHASTPERKEQKIAYDQQRHIVGADAFRAYNHDRYHNNTDYRERELERARQRKHDPAHREYERERHYKRWADPEYRKKKTARLRYRRHNDPEYRRKVWHDRQRRRDRIKMQGPPFTEAEWVALCARYDHRCLACGEKKPLTVDHVIPISRGGTSDITNIQPLCLDCNRRKHTRSTDYRSLEQSSLLDGD